MTRQAATGRQRLSIGAIAASLTLASLPSPALADQICTYDPELGPNPLGMRTYITLSETEDGTTVLFEQLPSPVGAEANPPVTVALYRELTFYGVGIAETRQLMLNHPDYYNVLVDYPDPEGFGPINAVLSCG
ncbi:MAG: hypothetical protein HC929_11835 [Leptolyngbyaceae cyanobacterium SM2_5_2]|nr:hypothetical protein [Leptolyngbyaceae cyanobacterium SM2_5_2]